MDYRGDAGEGLLYGTEHDNIKKVDNADKFFENIYRYFVAKGIGAIVLSELCSVVTLAFTISFSVFMLAFVDWGFLMQCHDEESCSDSIIIHPFNEPPSMFRFFIFLYFMLCSSYWIYMCISSMNTISEALEMSTFYQDILGIKLIELQHLEWFQVVDRIIYVNNHGEQQLVDKDDLTAHDIVLRIMRKENYLVGLINKNKLDLFVPWWISPFTTEHLFLTKSLEWSLSFCIMDYMFTENLYLSSEFINDVAGLQWRFQVVGLIHFLLLPFMLIFMAVNFFLQNAQQFHSSKAYLGPRQWSPLAMWKFREFNELPHVFDDRINRSLAPANDYINSFYNPYAAILARCATYVTGSFIATLLLVSLLSDGALLYVHVAEYNLLWYLGIFSACYAGARSLIPDETKAQVSPALLLQQVCAHTHYFPAKWENLARSEDVKNEVCDMFQYKAQLFLMELLSVVLTPAVLCFSLPSCAGSVLAFIREHTKYVKGVGAVCAFSLFEFEQYGDENFGTEKSGVLPPSERANDGKMEKSFMNFKKHHPNYEGGAAAQNMVNRIHAYKDNKRQEHRDQMLASIIEQTREDVYSPNAFAGAAVGTESPEPSSPVTRHDNHHHHGHGHGQGQGRPQGQEQYAQQGDMNAYHGVNPLHGGHAPAQPGFRIHSHEPAAAPGAGGATGGFYGNGPVVSRPVSFGLGVGASATDLTPESVHTESTTDLETLRLVPPERAAVQITGPTQSTEASGPEQGEDSAHLFEGAFSSAERKTSVSDLASDSGEVMSPIVQRESDARPGIGLFPPPSKPQPRPLPAVLPGQVEMSSLLNQSTQHKSILRGFAHNASSSRSLVDSALTPHRSGFHYQNRSKGDLPSVLLSVMRQENIDYENDFYWMAQFHADRLRDPASVERSVMRSPRGGRARRSTSGGVGGSSMFGGFMSPPRGITRHLSPPFDSQPFSPGIGMAASAMDSASASGMYLSSLPQPGVPQQQAPSHQRQHDVADGSEGREGGEGGSSPRFQYGSNISAGGASQSPMVAPGSDWNTYLGVNGGYMPLQHAPAAVWSRGPASRQKKSTGGLDCLLENDAEES